MRSAPDLHCRDVARRAAVRTAPVYGIDFIDVDDDGTTLDVFFLGRAPERIDPANVRIEGGARVQDIKATNVRVRRSADPALDDTAEVQVDKRGDFSRYTLRLVELDADGRPTDETMRGFDIRYDRSEFSFKAGCPSGLDCAPPQTCPPPARVQPEINYLAKDYESFRQLMLDRLALTMPDWRESHAPDVGIALVELLAYVADYLSYYQDAVATEAYLGTARQRISVRRHARLVDYRMHEGCNARAWLTIAAEADARLDPAAVYFITGFPGAPSPGILQPAALAAVPPESFEVFEPVVADRSVPIPIYAAHTKISFYTWGNRECCLRAGATTATLIDRWIPTAPEGDDVSGPPQRALKLQPGDILILEEILGPRTGNPADADPTHRQAVRLVKVTTGVDPLFHAERGDAGQPIVDIEWCWEDALKFPLCISSQSPPPDCEYLTDVSVARGNVLLVDHGRRVSEPLGSVPAQSTSPQCATKCSPPETTIVPGRFAPTLAERPLTFSQPLPACGCASALIANDPRNALPQIALTGTVESAGGSLATQWTARGDLLESGPEADDFVVELDNDGHAHLRFGDGTLGRMPPAGTAFDAAYRIGNGPDGNVGAETIVHLVFRETTEGTGALVPRNPLPARGGTAPESIDDVKMFAPHAFRKGLQRAITADDYAALAADNARRLSEGHDVCLGPFRTLQGARSQLRWSGSWYEALVALDPRSAGGADEELLLELGRYIEPYRRVGHDVRVRMADYVPLDLALVVCVLPHFQRGHVEAALLDTFSNRVRPDGRLGFFHPDNLTFGQGIYVSQIIAAAAAIPGVQEVQVARLERYEIDEPPLGVQSAAQEVPPNGVLALGPFEIARLDNDPNEPVNGRLILDLRGGR